MRIEISIDIIKEEKEEKKEKKLDTFGEHLKWASKVVNSWPEWKKGCLKNFISPEK